MSVPTSLIPQDLAKTHREQYRAALFDDLVPWWESYSVDREQGGYYSCLERDGKVYAGDKFTWMLARQTWMFSHLYNNYQPRPDWLEIAQHGAEFLLEHAFTDGGDMVYRMSRDGRTIARRESLNGECFTTIGLAELSKAAGSPALWQQAMEMYDRIRPRLGQPSNTPLLGYPIEAQFHLLAHDMIRLTVARVLDQLQPDERWQADLNLSMESILQKHWKPELGALLENVAPDGSAMLDYTEGRLLHPGHALESAWMMLEVAHHQQDAGTLATVVDIIVATLEQGWDKEQGGIRYLINLDATPTPLQGADMKLWWVHAEAIYAALLAWVCTGREDLGRWYKKIYDYTFTNFPDQQCGEWYGYLNRDGSIVFDAKANGSKGFFHVPRVLLRCYTVFNQELADQTTDDEVLVRDSKSSTDLNRPLR